MQYNISAEDIVEEFKKQGHFDIIRRKLFNQFQEQQNDEFTLRLTQQMERCVQYDRSCSHSADSKALQRKLQKDIEQNTSLLVNLRKDAQDSLQANEFQTTIETTISSIIDALSSKVANSNESAVEDAHKMQRQDESRQVQPPSRDFSIIDDILNFSSNSKVHQPSNQVQSFSEAPAEQILQDKVDYDKSVAPVDVKECMDLDKVVGADPYTSDLTDVDDLMQYSSGAQQTSSDSDGSVDEMDENADIMSMTSEDKNLDGRHDTEQQQPMLFSEVFLRGQKLAASVDVKGSNRWIVVIVKAFDPHNGLYTCLVTDPEQDVHEIYQLPFEQLLHFNHVDKDFKVGRAVQALHRSKTGRTMGSMFHAGQVTMVGRNVVHVKFDDSGDTAVLKHSELFTV